MFPYALYGTSWNTWHLIFVSAQVEYGLGAGQVNRFSGAIHVYTDPTVCALVSGLGQYIKKNRCRSLCCPVHVYN